MESNPLFSVVTPSYNQGPFIRATIESVLSQDYPNVEYIIMDGGSTDETSCVVKDYASRLTFISEKDRGQAHAINKGFRMARGRFLSWLNSDDLYLPGMIRAAIEGFQKSPRAGAVYGEGYLIDQTGRVSSRFPFTEPFNLWKLVHLSDYILQQTVAFRKEVLDDVGYLDEDLHYVLDWDLLIRIGMKYPLEYIPVYMGCLREYAEAKTFAGGARRIREMRRMLRRHTGRLLPAGYVVYGLDTHHRLWCDSIDHHLPTFKPVANLLKSTIRSAALWLIGRTIRDAQGLYSDGWASRSLHYMLPPGGGSLVLQGQLPDWDSLRGQNLRISANGRLLGSFDLASGAFHFNAKLPESLQNSALALKIVANRWIRPIGDRRCLAYKLDSIRLAVGSDLEETVIDIPDVSCLTD
ncbi:MAG TPA: glycosyltransferase family 2 protein [Terriglobia bacterium]|nr:glycosyltransferase family 2 protein [Terriglobia bacterium]